MSTEEILYRTDVINAAMGAQRLTNKMTGKKARVATKTVSAIRNGNPDVQVSTLKKVVVDALGLSLSDIFTGGDSTAQGGDLELSASGSQRQPAHK